MSSLASVTDLTFQATIDQGLTLVDFWAPWCRPCLQLTPTLEKVAEALGDRAKVVKMDIDANPEAAVQLGIMSIPALLLFKNGRRVAPISHQGSVADIVAQVAMELG